MEWQKSLYLLWQMGYGIAPKFWWSTVNVTVQYAMHITDHHPMLYNRIFLSHSTFKESEADM